MEDFFNLLLHADEQIGQLILEYGRLTYLILCTIIFIETGLVVVNFFPGDGLLFSAGVLAANGELNLSFLLFSLSIATFLGNTSNFFIGKYLGIRFFKKENTERNQHLAKALFYFEKYGSKAVLVSRFFPFMRSFIPFVAGLTNMKVSTFSVANFIGGISWIATYVLLGYFLGEIPIVKKYFGLVLSVLFIVIIISGAIGFLRWVFSPKKEV